MTPQTLQLLHVEDAQVERAVVARHLSALKDLRFAVEYAASEDEGVRRFSRGGFDLVILDYHLDEGDGLSCLRRIRRADALVPVIALSGVATPETAAELLRGGADDFISKHQLTAEVLGHSVRAALKRASAWREHAPAGTPEPPAPVHNLFAELCRDFAATGPALLARLDAFESAARGSGLTVGQLQRLFEGACRELRRPDSPAEVERLLRPVLLEVALRLFGTSPPRAS
jgi:DNA-binding response OmpR family regulator